MTTTALMLLALLTAMTAVEFLIHRPDRRNQQAAHDESDATWAAECLRLHALKASAEADARQAEERRQGAFDANVSLSRKSREADDEAFRVAQEFRDHLDSHACLPTLKGIRAGLDVGDGPEPPLSLETRGVVVPLRKRGGR